MEHRAKNVYEGLGILEFKFADHESFGLNIQMMAAELYYAVKMLSVIYFPKSTTEFCPKWSFNGTLWNQLTELTFSPDFSTPSPSLLLSSFGLPYHLSMSGCISLCQIKRTTGTSMHEIHTIFFKERTTLSVYNKRFVFNFFDDLSWTTQRMLLFRFSYRDGYRWSRQHRRSNGVCFGNVSFCFLFFLQIWVIK